MASDNTTLNPGLNGDSIRDLARLSGSVKTQVVQLDFGGASTNAESLHSASNPLPVNPIALPAQVTSIAAASLIMKAAPGSLYSLMATSTSAGWIMLFDATSAPTDGTVTPKWVYPLITTNAALNMAWINPLVFTTGIVAVFSTTGPFTKTASASAFISGQIL